MRSEKKQTPAVKADPSWRIGIVHSSFYTDDVARLISGAKEVLRQAEIKGENITEHAVTGSFEIPLIGAVLAQEKKVDALIGLGIIVEGETHHAELVAAEAARGMMDVQTRYGVPFAFEVLYVKTLEQADVRSSGVDNKGGEAATAVLHSLAEIQKLRS